MSELSGSGGVAVSTTTLRSMSGDDGLGALIAALEGVQKRFHLADKLHFTDPASKHFDAGEDLGEQYQATMSRLVLHDSSALGNLVALLKSLQAGLLWTVGNYEVANAKHADVVKDLHASARRPA